MYFFEFKSELKSHFPNFMEKRIFIKPTKRYYCPGCHKEKRKLVGFFELHDLKKDLSRYYEFDNPICENCFEFKSYNELMNHFYDTDIY